jgi:hypothetical protein
VLSKIWRIFLNHFAKLVKSTLTQKKIPIFLEKTFEKICPEKNTGLVQCWTVIRKRNSQTGHSGYQGGS